VVREPSGASADATMVTLHRGEPVTTRPVLRFVEACFDELGKHQVAEDHRDEDEKELDRQRSEAEHVLERRERQDCSDGGTRDRQGDHRPARSETPRPAPWCTMVPMNAQERRSTAESVRTTGSCVFGAAIDSPPTTPELGLADGGVRVGVALLGDRGGRDDQDGSVGVLQYAMGHASQQQ
jgi:hypothetical protein